MNITTTFSNLREINDLIRSSGLNTPAFSVHPRELCSKLITNSEIGESCLKLFEDGHNALAIETAFKLINNYVKSKSGLADMDGVPLMQTALSITNPKIKLNKLKTKSERDEQLGYMNILVGCMTGIRNPRAHEHDHKDTDRNTLELLLLADHLMQKLKSASAET